MNIEGNYKKVSLTAVGDVLMHGRVYGGFLKKSGYTLKEQLQNAAPLLGQTDITIVNLESIIAGVEMGLSSYPKFNGPVEIAKVLKDMGTDILNLSNNHILDRGVEGLFKSIENIEKIGLEYVGGYKSAEDHDRLRIVTRNGLRICFLSYTRGTNFIEIPKDKPYIVDSLRTIPSPEVRIPARIRNIKKKGLADVVVVNLHYGEEYHLEPSRFQRELSASLADAGADVIIGHHPHVLQPPEWIETSLGTKTFVAYSLGNFFTGQNGVHRQIGASLTLDIKKHEKYKGVIIENPKYVLTFTERTKPKRYDLFVFKDWIKDHEYIETAQGIFSSKQIYEETINRMRKQIKDLDIV